MSGSTLFGPTPYSAITVGYIDPNVGLVENVSISDANKYAESNPGTVFIFRDGDRNIRYLNINEVNLLTPNDLLRTQPCDSSPRLFEDSDLIGADGTGGLGRFDGRRYKISKPRIQFWGGGGIGAVGNPIISRGRDGSLLAVDLIRGGHGYKNPPFVALKDDSKRGSGAVLEAVIGNTTTVTEEFDAEEDFEEYKIIEEEDFSSTIYGPNGESLGKWNPDEYFSLGEDPIAKEIDTYQKSLLELKNPFWTTRKRKPTKISSPEKSYVRSYDVTFPDWNEFMNKYAISPVSPSNVKGSDNAGKLFTLEWVEEFPYTGEYTFRGLCDNSAKVYIDNLLIGELASFKDAVLPVKTTITEGIHRIRVDLVNLPQYETKDIKIEVKEKSKVLCHAGGGFGGTENIRQSKVGKVIVGTGGNGQFGGDDDGGRRGGGVGLPDGTNAGKNYSFRGNGGNGATLDGFIKKGEANLNDTGDGKDGGNFGGGGGGAQNGKRGGNGGNGAVKITWGSTGRSISYTEPGTYKIEVPRSRPGRDEVTSVRVVCIGGGGSGYTDTDGDKQGSGGSGGAFSTATEKLKSGTILKVVVGKGGVAPLISEASQTRTGGGSEDGGDSYVEILPNNDEEKNKDSNIPTLKNQKIFNTIDFIKKANRTLWRANPVTHPKDSLLHKYGVCPFDTTKDLENNPYDGVHTIIWQNVNFPVDGNYTINVAVDDNVTIYIGNRESGGFRNDGSGLSEDEVIITKRGYVKGTTGEDRFVGRPLPDLNETRFFKKGNYRIRADLEQTAQGAFTFSERKNANPMALAIDIEAVSVTREVKSDKSWNENPLGVSLAIDAPKPSIPQEIPPIRVGRCPPNPIWSTRFPSSSERWYPVRYLKDGAWSDFMNRYAISPVKPTDKPGGDGSGVVYSNSWTFTAPYRGFYAVKGTRDNLGRILIDGVEISKLDGFNVKNPKSKKVFLEAGEHTVTVEVYNQPIILPSILKQIVFSTLDWQVEKKTDNNEPKEPKILCHAGGGFGGTENKKQTKVGKVIVGTGGNGQPGGDDDTKRRGGGVGLPDGRNAGKNYSFSGNGGNGATLDGKIIPGEENLNNTGNGKNGGNFGGGGGGGKNGRQGGDGGDGAVRIIIGTTGKKYEWVKPGRYKFEVPRSRPGRDDVTLCKITCIGGGGSGYTDTDGDKEGSGGSGGAFAKNEVRLKAGTKLIINVGKGGKSPRVSVASETKSGGISRDGEDTFVSQVEEKNNPEKKKEVEYIGPPLFHHIQTTGGPTGRGWSSFMNKYSVSPKLFEKIDEPSENINGDFTLTWKNVIFPETGEYRFKFQADNIATLFLDSERVRRTSDFSSDPNTFVIKVEEGRHNIEIRLTNVRNTSNIFSKNPSGVSLVITKDQNIDKQRLEKKQDSVSSWAGIGNKGGNPIGISAVIIAPPCPKETGGKGTVTDIYIIDPGNGYPETTPPVSPPLSSLLPSEPGIIPDVGPPPGPGTPPGTPPPGPGTPPGTPPPGPGTPPGTPGVPSEIPPTTAGNAPVPETPQYPVTLSIKEIIVTDPGINYRCGFDEVVVVPDNGAKLSYSCDPFGRITKVNVDSPGIGFTEYPRIIVRTPNVPNEQPTGINFSAIPVFEVIRDPVEALTGRLPQESLIQVTDLVGLKQTGYINGRAYYGAVFYENGIRYAGYYKTAGELIPVYDTLQESIEGRVTTRPSAIQRSGTDISSNNPRLNIPNTINDLT